jgi:SAM-dependent methyltransferase
MEHIGLGRYGDELDAQGDIKAARELVRVLKPGGQLLMVTPMNEFPHIRYNADRYYSKEMVMGMFEPLELRDFCYLYNDQVNRTPIPREGHYTGCMVWVKA